MDPITISALIAGGTGLLGSFLQGSSNRSVADKNLQAARETNAYNEKNVMRTNATNLSIAEMNNQFNRENLQMQNDWNLAQWNRENLYNDPSSQVSRLLAAGINPYNAGLDGSGNAAGNLQSASASPADDSGRQIPFQAEVPRYDYSSTVFNDFAQGVMSIAKAAGENYDVQERRASFDVRMKQIASQIDYLESLKNLNSQQRENLKELKETYRLNNMFADQTFAKRVESVGLQNAVMRSQSYELNKRAALNEANTAYMQLKPDLEKMSLGIQQQQVDAYIQDSLRSYALGMSELSQRKAEMDLSESQFKREQQLQIRKLVGDWHWKARDFGIEKKKADSMANMLEQQALRYKWMRTESQLLFPLQLMSLGQDVLGKGIGNAGRLIMFAK